MFNSITPRLIAEAAERRGWRCQVIDGQLGLYRLQLPGGRFFYGRSVTTVKSALINTIIADHKQVLYKLAPKLGIPVPAWLHYNGDMQQARRFLREYGVLVVKPADGSHGRGITVNVRDDVRLEAAIRHSQGFSQSILLQQQVSGADIRVLMIGGKLAAAARRLPAFVVGDGMHTVSELIELENKNPERGHGYSKRLTFIDPAAAARYFEGSGGDMLARPEAGQRVQVVGTANIGQGGVAIDITDTLDGSLLHMAQTIVEHFAMPVCGIDFIRASAGKAYVLEMNSGPSLGLHEFPYEGQPRGTPDMFLDMLISDQGSAIVNIE